MRYEDRPKRDCPYCDEGKIIDGGQVERTCPDCKGTNETAIGITLISYEIAASWGTLQRLSRDLNQKHGLHHRHLVPDTDIVLEEITFITIVWIPVDTQSDEHWMLQIQKHPIMLTLLSYGDKIQIQKG